MALTYITNGKIVLPGEVVSGKILAFDRDQGKICGVVDELPADADVIDAAGNYVAPGLVDIHIHGYLGEDTSDGKPEGLKKMAYGVAKNGVTSFLPTTMTVAKEQIVAALDAVRAVKEESRTWDGAEILGVHAEGPFINPSKKGAQAEENILVPDADFILAHADVIKSVTLAPEMDEGHACIKKLAAESNVLVSMGHTDAKFEEAMKNIAMLGGVAKKLGMTLLYHNHDFEFIKLDGKYGLDVMYDTIPAELLQTELDMCWVNVGGEEPASYLRKYSGRAPVLHLKDFYGEKSDDMYELIGMESAAPKRPGNFEFRPVGSGLQDFPAILEAAKDAGVTWVVVEQDNPSMGLTPLASIEKSRQYLKSIGN